MLQMFPYPNSRFWFPLFSIWENKITTETPRWYFTFFSKTWYFLLPTITSHFLYSFHVKISIMIGTCLCTILSWQPFSFPASVCPIEISGKNRSIFEETIYKMCIHTSMVKKIFTFLDEYFSSGFYFHWQRQLYYFTVSDWFFKMDSMGDISLIGKYFNWYTSWFSFGIIMSRDCTLRSNLDSCCSTDCSWI